MKSKFMYSQRIYFSFANTFKLSLKVWRNVVKMWQVFNWAANLATPEQ